jgi:hypothetical protein
MHFYESEKRTVPQLFKKFPVLCRTRRFVAVFTRKCQLSPHPEPDESVPHRPILLRTILIIIFHLCLGLPHCLLQDFPPKPCVYFFPHPALATCLRALHLHYVIRVFFVSLLSSAQTCSKPATLEHRQPIFALG